MFLRLPGYNLETLRTIFCLAVQWIDNVTRESLRLALWRKILSCSNMETRPLLVIEVLIWVEARNKESSLLEHCTKMLIFICLMIPSVLLMLILGANYLRLLLLLPYSNCLWSCFYCITPLLLCAGVYIECTSSQNSNLCNPSSWVSTSCWPDTGKWQPYFHIIMYIMMTNAHGHMPFHFHHHIKLFSNSHIAYWSIFVFWKLTMYAISTWGLVIFRTSSHGTVHGLMNLY